MENWLALYGISKIGWAERSETHQTVRFRPSASKVCFPNLIGSNTPSEFLAMGFASLYPCLLFGEVSAVVSGIVGIRPRSG